MSHATSKSNEVAITQYNEAKYLKIKAQELSAAASTDISKDFFGYKIDQAFKADDGGFKVLVSNGQNMFFLRRSR